MSKKQARLHSGQNTSWNVELIDGIGQQIGRSNKDIESSILDATGVANIESHLDGCRRRNPDADDDKREMENEAKKDSNVARRSKNRPKEPEKAPQTPLLENLGKKFVERARMGTIQEPSKKEREGQQEATKRDNKKKAAKPAEVVDVEHNDGEYEYYSSSSEEPPAKKQKKEASKETSKGSSSKETMDTHAWKKRAMELAKIANKLTRENKSLRRQVAYLKERKTKKSKNWKRAVKSLLEAGGDSSSSEGKE